MQDLTGKRIAIMATHGFEFSELDVPRRKLAGAGAEVTIVSPESGRIRGWDHDDWGDPVDVGMALDDASADDFDALVVPGGQINPDLLRAEPKAVQLVRDFHNAGKTMGVICHGPWLLVEADLLKGRRATSYRSIRRDVENAGARWLDEEAVCDHGLVTSRNPGDLDAFCERVADQLSHGIHRDRVVA